MLTKMFWTVVALDGIAAIVLWKLFERGTHGLLVAVYLIVLAAIAIAMCAFPLLRSDALRTTAFLFLLLPSAPLLYTSIASVVRNVQDDRQFSGSAYFRGPALNLAQAMVNHDAGLVRQLIPSAGDLNHPQGSGMSLWQFGVLQADHTEASIDILRALLSAGADPKRDHSPSTLPHAVAVSPQLTRFLLEAGTNPNVLDNEHRPVWWQTMVQGEDDPATEPLRLMLDHNADLTLRGPDGRGPIGYAIGHRHWYATCLLIERGADWKQEKLRGGSVSELLEWEIIRRDEYPIPVPEKMRKLLAEMKGEPLVVPAVQARVEGELTIPAVLRETGVEKLEHTRALVSDLAKQPDWVRRVAAFFEEGDQAQRGHVALLLSLKAEALPEDVQERCWTVVREQMDWYDRSAASLPNERKGWLLKETAVIAVGLASIRGPVRERHRADFTGLRDRIEACRKANDPDAGSLADLKQVDWMAG